MVKRIIVILLVILSANLLAACGRLAGAPDRPVGTVSRVSDIVRRNQVQVVATQPLQQGEGLLVLGGQLILRLFNDTQVGGVQAEAAPGAPLLARLRLEFGGFTGQLAQPGSQVSFETPNGALVSVAGTDFFLVYSQERRETYCGNLAGQMWVEANGSGRLRIPAGAIYRVEPGAQPAPWRTIPWTMEKFTQMARAGPSPLIPIQVAARFTQPTAALDTAAPDVEILAVEPPRVAVGAECLGSAGMRPVIVRIGDETGLGQAVAGWVYNGAQDYARLQAIHDQTFWGGPLSV